METVNHIVAVCFADLPDHVLFLVADRLSRKRDLIRFGAVCQSWQSVYMEVRRYRSPKLPLLMLATEEHNCGNQTRSFYDLTHKRVCNFNISVPHKRRCPGSSHGWLFMVCPDSQVRLLNLFSSSPGLNSKEEIHLPPLPSFKHCTILQKAVLSGDPAFDPNYVVLAIYDGHGVVAFFKSGDKSWTSLDTPCIRSISDVIYYRDQFYAVNKDGEVYAWDLNHSEPKVVKVAPRANPRKSHDKRYLVESPSGDLLQVIRHTDFEEEGAFYYNAGFYMLKLDPVEHEWIELDNIDRLVLFLGDNMSLCLSALDFPQCKPDSVYYTDDFWEGYAGYDPTGNDDDPDEAGPHEMGIFSFEDRTTTPHYPMKTKFIYPPPIWIEPPCRR